MYLCGIDYHPLVCRVFVQEPRIECYDSIWFRLDKTARLQRIRQLAPLRFLCPWLISSVDDYRRDQYRLLVAEAGDVFCQTDDVSCGVYCCMQIERLLTGSPSVQWASENTGAYREHIACSIFGLTDS